MRPSNGATIERKLFTARRTGLACDRNRAINRLRGTLTSMFPALERTLELTTKGAGRSRRAGQAAAGRHPAAVGRCVAVEDVDDRQLSRGPVIDPRAFRTVAARQALPRVIGCLGNESADAPDPGQ
jgi:hypothetical protein